MLVKSPFQSRVILLNAVAMAAALYQHFVAPIGNADPQVYALLVAMANIALRFRTSVPVAL